MQTTSAPPRTGSTTYAGIYLRNNQASKGTIPANSPFDLCPDIIQSARAITDPGSTLSSIESWETTYRTDPALGKRNYYYVRGMNGAAVALTGDASLYQCPSALVLWPSLWKDKALTTAAGSEDSTLKAGPGHIAVTEDPFTWKSPPPPPSGSDYYAFVARISDPEHPNPIPQIDSWTSMGRLLSNEPGFGWRNMAFVDGEASEWERTLTFVVPPNVSTPGGFSINVSATGLSGDYVGFIGDRFDAKRNATMLLPMQVRGDGLVAGVKVDVEAGFECSLRVQYWNASGTPPQPGSTVSLEATYLPTTDELVEGFDLGLFDESHDRLIAEALGVGPQPTIRVGEATFVVADEES